MRRTLIPLGSIAAAGMLAFAGTQSAVAASGLLIVNGVSYENPGAGCYAASDEGAQVDNQTDSDAEVFLDAACADGPVNVIGAGDSGDVDPGGSIRLS
ncbi:hypothetical protein [Streptomyces sp. ITFR-6]|uniref:hypothetical protein n=1 Tax=Streptomyces sp. ITFR-6 TaxID=3075197 RepID=UPI00288B60A9|nr:hypothetical protein [Streptomyces sp. ITFR-6]WNI31381.1 hypothetical protein RLT59_23275 [Streptomyces sp. ITFR-6]